MTQMPLFMRGGEACSSVDDSGRKNGTIFKNKQKVVSSMHYYVCYLRFVLSSGLVDDGPCHATLP